MLHSSHHEQPIEVVDVHYRMLSHEAVDRFVVVDRVARANDLIAPSSVLDNLAVMRWSDERRNIRVDSL